MSERSRDQERRGESVESQKQDPVEQESKAHTVDARQTPAAESASERLEAVRAARDRVAQKADRPDAVQYGDWTNKDVRDGQITLTLAQKQECDAALDTFFSEVGDSKMATSTGYQVAGAYDVRVQGWTTRSKIVEVEGKKIFVLCSFSAGNTRRRFDRVMETVSGDPMHKPTPRGWKRTVESRSEIPTVAGTRPDMVAMPYIESFNAYDLFAHQKDVRDFGAFGWAKEAGVGDKLALVKPISEALAKLHGSGKTWGEAILPNVILDHNRKPTFVDPETTYEGIPEDEQRARDVRTLIGSIAGALARGDGQRDYAAVAHLVLEGYGDDVALMDALDRLCAQPMGFRQKMTFEFWGKFRVGASDGREFEDVRLAIKEAISELRALSKK